MKDQIICGDTLTVLKDMPSESIDCVITSPPFWGLRDYGIDGKLGLEPTFQLYIEHLQTIFDEIYRILKKTGTCWVDIGDTYGGASGWGWDSFRDYRYDIANHGDKWGGKRNVGVSNTKVKKDGHAKSLCNIPFRFAISMTDHNWIERNCIIWHKPSCMPSSAKDRFTVDFEYVFFFTKNKKYYFEQQFEDMSDATRARDKYPFNGVFKGQFKGSPNEKRWQDGRPIETPTFYNERGRNRRCVWAINPQPFKDAHFAVFPEKLVEPMVRAGCPSAICDSCGKPYENKIGYNYHEKREVKDVENSRYVAANRNKSYETDYNRRKSLPPAFNASKTTEVKKCNCDAPTHAGIVLDPFVGSGTTCLVARKLGRHYIGIDLQPEYVAMAKKRLSEVL